MYGTEQMNVFGFLQNELILGMLLVILLFISITKGALLPSRTLSFQEIHLVRCLTNISQRYFSPGLTLVISSPATYRDVQQELIAEIHRTSIWPVVVTVDGNISKTYKTDFIDRDGSYIILLQNGNFKRFEAEINGIAKDGTIFKRLWNSETRFVVAGANKFSMSQQTDIFDYLSQLRIYNCIIVSREHFQIDKNCNSRKNVNDVDTGMKLGVYTWFPYQSSDRCTEVNDITLLDSWVISAQGHFTKNTDLFPVKISKNLKGCPMKAVVRNSYWYFTTDFVTYLDSNGSFVTESGGMEFKLLMLILKHMNMTFIHVPTPEGFEMEVGLTRNLISAMIAKKIYVALGGVGTHYLTDPFLDITNNHYVMTFRWYVPCSVKYQRWSSIFRIFSVELWLILIISIMFAAILTTLVGRYTCTSEWHGYKTLASSMTNLWAVILGVSVSTMPRAPSLRSLFLAWVCFSVAFSTVFQAFLTTFLIDSGYETQIKNMDELFASSMKLSYQPENNFIFATGEETDVSNVQKNLANCLRFWDCYQWAIYDKNVSIMVDDHEIELSYAFGDILGENSEPLLCKLEDGLVYTNGLRMVMFHGDPLLRRVTEIIDRVVEAGLCNFWISQPLHGIKLISRKISLDHPFDGYYSFNLYHMQSAFYLLLMGWCLSAVCFMFELLYNRVLRKIK